jgi:transcriptional regulator with PAS, ATPase and Fis domain
VRDKTGLFELASAGTLFLDEIGELAPTIQAKLLRALQEGEVRKVGGERNIRVSPRVIAATNRDLKAAVARGSFREDLYFRLGAFVIEVPPLRERREEIPALTHQFLRAAARLTKKDVRGVSAEAMTLLMRHRWPGNVRELEHTIQRAVILAHGATVSVRELPPELRSKPAEAPPGDTLDLARNERSVIERALRRFRGNRRRAAKALNISTVTLWRRMKRYGLKVPPDPGD